MYWYISWNIYLITIFLEFHLINSEVIKLFALADNVDATGKF